MKHSRRDFLQHSAAGVASVWLAQPGGTFAKEVQTSRRTYRFTQIDVFTSRKMEGNQLAVFPDARGLSDEEMQAIARETNLQETTFVIPRDPAIEKARGVKVRIFIPEQEIPFGGHPTLGTAFVLRNNQKSGESKAQEISLDLQVGKVPVAFSADAAGNLFGEMRQVDPAFGKLHDREVVASMVGIRSDEIVEDLPIQTVSTGLPFAVVPLKKLSTLQSLRPNHEKIDAYFSREKVLTDFYYITRDTQEPGVGLRTRGIYSSGEDPATGSASGCTIAWMVRHGVAKSGERVHIRQGVEIKRPSDIYASAEAKDDKISNVRVGGNAVEIMRGEYEL